MSGPVTVAPAPRRRAESAPPRRKPQPTPAAAEAPRQPSPSAKPEPKPEPKAAAKPAAQGATTARRPRPCSKASRRKSRPPPKAASWSRWARSPTPAKAREARQKVERAGLKTYTNVAETKDGKRIRVRVGPFANRAEADKAADKIKGLDLPAAILTL